MTSDTPRTDGEESYEVYLAKISECPIAKAVKLADLIDNLADTPTPYQVEKYSKAIALLCLSGT